MTQRATHVGFDGLYGNAQQVGDFRIAQIAFTTEREHFARTRRQRGYGVMNGGNQFGAACLGVGGHRGLVQGFQMKLRLLLHLEMPQMIEGAIARRLHEVGRHGTAIRQAIPAPPQFEKDVLRDFLGHALIAQDALGHTDDRLVPLTKKRVKGVVLTGAQAGQEIGVGHVGDEGGRRRRAGGACVGLLIY